MKRIAAILTSLVLVFSLAACGSQQAGTAAGSEAASTASSETASAAQTKTEEQLLGSIGNQLFQRSHIGLLINAAHDRLPNDVALTVHNTGCGESHDAQCKLAGLAARIKVDIAEGCAC